MTKKLFRNAVLFLTFVLGGFFLNSCSDLNFEKEEEVKAVKIATVSFGISDSISDAESRTVLPNSDDHDIKKYLYLYNYTLTYVNENGEEEAGEENIICNDFSYEKFCNESNIRLATGKKYKFTLKAKDGAVTRMEGSSIITLSEKPEQKVTIVLMPAGEEYGQKLRVDWIVPDDGVITTMKAGISPERGHAENQTDEEIREILNKAVNINRTEEELSDLVEKFKFHEYSFSIIDNPFAADDPRKDVYGSTVKRIGVTYDDVKTGVSRWLDYKFYDANGILVYESSESVYMIGGKTSSTVIYITPDHYYRRPVIIPVNIDGALWGGNSDLEVKLVDKEGHEYILKPVLDGEGNPTGKFEGLLPGASSGDGTAETTDGIFDIYVGLEGNEDSGSDGFVKTGAEYNANTGKIAGNGSTDSVELVTVKVPQPEDGVTLTPVDGVVGTNGTVGDGSGNGGLIVPAGQDFTVKVELDLGYKTGDDGKITIGGKEVSDGENVTLNADDVAGEITLSGVSVIEYSIVYKSVNTSDVNKVLDWRSDYTPVSTFTIESDDITLPEENDFAEADKHPSDRIAGWWFGEGTADDNLDNLIKKINKEKTVKEKLIHCAENNNNTLVLNVYWLTSEYIEYRIEYMFEELGSNPANYIEDETVVDAVNENNVVPFHNAIVKNGVETDVNIPQVIGFTSAEIKTKSTGVTSTPAEGFTKITVPGTGDDTIEIHYKRKTVTITLDGNKGNWAVGESTKTLNGKYGESHDHIADPVREDFRFLGWYVKGDTTQTPIKHVDDHRFPAESKDYVAKWEQTHANYTVEFYYEDADSTAANPKYTKTSTHTVKGVVGSFPAFNTTPQTGFTYNASKREIKAGEYETSAIQVDEEGNGITLVRLYFDRKTIEFTLKTNGGKFTDGNGNFTDEIILEGKYGAPLPSVDSRGFRVEIPQPPVLDEHAIDDGTSETNDFTFKAWHVRTESDLEATLPSTFPAENAIYAARWNQINGIYKVVHWAESMDKYENGEYKLLAPKAIDGFSGQMLEGSVTKKGKIGEAMVYYHDAVKGFKAPTVEIRNSLGTTGNVAAEDITAAAKQITADAKTEVIITYLRKDYTIRFHLNASGDTNAKWVSPDAGAGSSETVTRTGKYRTDFTPPANPVREHFIFRGWTKDAPGTLDDRVDVVPSFTDPEIDGSPTDYYAVWYSKASGGLETDTSDISLQWSLDSTKTIIEANAVGNILATGDWSYAWSINDVPVLAGSPEVTFVNNGKGLKLTGCLEKDYEITVVATHDGKVYTKTEIVTVE